MINRMYFCILPASSHQGQTSISHNRLLSDGQKGWPSPLKKTAITTIWNRICSCQLKLILNVSRSQPLCEDFFPIYPWTETMKRSSDLVTHTPSFNSQMPLRLCSFLYDYNNWLMHQDILKCIIHLIRKSFGALDWWPLRPYPLPQTSPPTGQLRSLRQPRGRHLIFFVLSRPCPCPCRVAAHSLPVSPLSVPSAIINLLPCHTPTPLVPIASWQRGRRRVRCQGPFTRFLEGGAGEKERTTTPLAGEG